MSAERWLITGALGCIGSWCCRQLVREGHAVAAFDLGEDRRRLELVMSAEELGAVEFLRGDITDLEAVERALAGHRITHVLHLAAMLLPLAATDPPRGALVNVVGTVNMFEAVKRRGLPGLAYASSVAVYDRADGLWIAEDADGHPVSHYGVHKQANEGAARVYWLDDGLASTGLRPHIVYGPGRDHGMTAGPTLAMLAALRGERYEIPFGGRAQFQYAPDAAALFIDAARTPGPGAVVRNLGGPSKHIAEVISAIERALPEAAGTITFKDQPLPLPEDLEAVHAAATTPLAVGVRETIDLLRETVAA
ncbi:MAG: NAD(P)-dependent oxidoreductase [Solirubrobacterales bacterium]|nr:NAD(P)-dependent oxidoreductase [Solirubrobacterales bacterium]MBV9472210.1 NAD(P)-dependent oxidoreductase [Solirubrobacterales bacterium]